MPDEFSTCLGIGAPRSFTARAAAAWRHSGQYDVGAASRLTPLARVSIMHDACTRALTPRPHTEWRRHTACASCVMPRGARPRDGRGAAVDPFTAL